MFRGYRDIKVFDSSSCRAANSSKWMQHTVAAILLTLLGVWGNKAFAQISNSPENDPTASRRNAITRAVQEISPAVVGINVTAVQEQQNPLGFNDPFFRQFFKNDPFLNQLLGPQKIEIQSLGSGFIISPDGYIVTNEHVVKDATRIIVTMTDGSKRSAKIIGHDDQADIALLKIDGDRLPYCKLGDSDSILVGEWVIAFGNPFGLFNINDKPTVTVGVVSSLGMNLAKIGSRNYSNMIETDAAINPGNSGGPLVDADGRVIGMNTMIYTGGVSNSYIGYGFAIPANKIRRVVRELRKYGKVVNDAWIGLQIQRIDQQLAKYFGLSDPTGALVSNVEEGSPADKSGFKPGDLILKYQGMPVRNAAALQSLLDDLRPGQRVKFEVLRKNRILPFSLTVEKKGEE
ncbi:MAG: trypsin-like peptidase domain-containing protein [Bacteroidetes bacterium]|nr:trypsin-like peptidase domain-containing protein [Bacteroidota bacterium]